MIQARSVINLVFWGFWFIALHFLVVFGQEVNDYAVVPDGVTSQDYTGSDECTDALRSGDTSLCKKEDTQEAETWRITALRSLGWNCPHRRGPVIHRPVG